MLSSLFSIVNITPHPILIILIIYIILYTKHQLVTFPFEIYVCIANSENRLGLIGELNTAEDGYTLYNK